MNVSVCGRGGWGPSRCKGKAALLQLHHFFVELPVLHQRSMVIPSTSVHLLPLLALQLGLQVTLAGLCLATSCSLPPPLMSLRPPTVARKHRLATFPQSHQLLFSLEPSIFIHLQSWRACREVIADELLPRIARMLFTLQVCVNHVWTHLENRGGRIDPNIANVDANVGINIDLHLNLYSDWNLDFASVYVD